MYSLVDILLFKTPFESPEVFEIKFERIRTMFQDYCVHTGLELKTSLSENNNYTIYRFFDSEKGTLDISFSFQKNLSDISYFPAGIVYFYLNPSVFQKENIEHFLNDIISFIWNVFSIDFFIDYHADYVLNDRNKGKKFDYLNLKHFDMHFPKSPQNKQLLDSLMYVYFGLMKNIYNLEENKGELDKFLENTTPSEIEASFDLFLQRGDQTKHALISQARLIRAQIDSFIQLLS